MRLLTGSYMLISIQLSFRLFFVFLSLIDQNYSHSIDVYFSYEIHLTIEKVKNHEPWKFKQTIPLSVLFTLYDKCARYWPVPFKYNNIPLLKELETGF